MNKDGIDLLESVRTNILDPSISPTDLVRNLRYVCDMLLKKWILELKRSDNQPNVICKETFGDLRINMRERVEDLGRIAEKLEKLLDEEFWNDNSVRPKDFYEIFKEKSESEQHNIIHNFAYGRRDMQEALYQILSIAEGTDRLNEKD